MHAVRVAPLQTSIAPKSFGLITKLPTSMPNMTGRPGYRTMEKNGGSSAQYLACTPCVPLFVHCLIRVEAEGPLDYQGRAGIISIVRWNLRPVIFGLDYQKLESDLSISQTCLPCSDLRVLQRYRTRGAPSPLPSSPKNAQK